MVAWSRSTVSDRCANHTPKNLHGMEKSQNANARMKTSKHKIVQTALAYVNNARKKSLGRNTEKHDCVYFRYCLMTDFYNLCECSNIYI